jgi:hypothetical protein
MSGQEKLPPEKPSTQAAERLAVIVDAAERAALSVIDDAEKEARRYLEEAQARADLIVAERLREAADLLESHRGEELPEPRLRSVPPEQMDLAEPAPDPIPAPEEAEEKVGDAEGPPAPDEIAEAAAPAAEPEPARPPGSAGARLLATQMAVSGSSRKEIEMRLRNGFEIEDTGEILDAILGPEE